jgi:hypothetical protein
MSVIDRDERAIATGKAVTQDRLPEALKRGDPRLPPRFWSHIVEASNGCWEWTAGRFRNGYAHSSLKGAPSDLAHRVTYVTLVASVPEKLCLDHLCRNRICVNPAHLEVVSPKENIRRAPHFHPAHCKHGHEYTPNNTWTHARKGDGRIIRMCRICNAANKAQWRARRRA